MLARLSNVVYWTTSILTVLIIFQGYLPALMKFCIKENGFQSVCSLLARALFGYLVARFGMFWRAGNAHCAVVR